MKKQGELTHKEAVKKALEELGGRARLRDIYTHAIPLMKYKPGSDIRATIRRLLQTTPELFRRMEGRKGWWELVSYQEEIANLKAQLIEKDEIIDVLMKRPTEDEFIGRLLEKLRTVWRDEKKTINEFRKILDAMGRSDIVQELDACLNGKSKKSVESSTPNIVINGDYVVDKHVGNEVIGVASGGTGINVGEDKK